MKLASNLYWRLLFKPNLLPIGGVVLLAFVVGFSGMATIAMTVPLMEAVFGATHMGYAGAGYSAAVLHFAATLLNFFSFAGDNKNYLIFTLLVFMSAMAILNSISLFIAQYYSVKVSQKIANRLRLQLLDKIVHGQYAYLTQQSRGTLLYDINNPPQSVARMVDLFGRMSVSFFQAMLVIGLMFYFSWQATLVLGLLGVLWWKQLRAVCTRISTRLGKEIYEIGQAMGRVDVDAIDGIKVVKSHNLESRILSIEEQLLEKQLKPKLLSDMLVRGIVLLNEALAGVVVIILGFATFGLGWIGMTFPQMIAFMFSIKRASPSLGTFNSMYVDFFRDQESLRVIDAIVRVAPSEKGGRLQPSQIDFLSLANLSFSYPGKEIPALDTVSCTMHRGEITALVGPSGAGKSTLVNLLMRLYDPTDGMIQVNADNLLELDLSGWRKKVGYVSQDIFLFNDSILHNIGLWNEAVTKEAVEEAARQAQIHEFILSLPQGYDTLVGDRGLKLSGGQCQRIVIAREILKNPEVIIFDEATSALDNLTEKAVYDSIALWRQKAIVVVVAHRLSTIETADQIIVLEKGRVESVGRHENLIGEAGLYARLYHSGATVSLEGAEGKI